MSWLTDIAGKAENFLNKIDQNAAVALSQATVKSSGKGSKVTKSLTTVDPEEVHLNDDVLKTNFPHVSSTVSNGSYAGGSGLKSLQDDKNCSPIGNVNYDEASNVAENHNDVPTLSKEAPRSSGRSKKSNKSLGRSKSPRKEVQTSKLSSASVNSSGAATSAVLPDQPAESELLEFLNDSSRKDLDEKIGLQNELATQTREFKMVMSNNRQLLSGKLREAYLEIGELLRLNCTQNDALKRKLAELENKTETKQEAGVESELLEAKEEIGELNSSLKNKEIEIIQLRQGLDHTLEKMKKLEVLRDTQNKLEFLEMEKQNLAKENEEMKSEITNFTSQAEFYESTIQAVKNSLSSVESEFVSYKEKAKSILKQKDEMISSLQSSSGLSNSRFCIDAENGNDNPFLPEIESLKSERELLNAEVSQSRATVDSLREEVIKLESDIVTSRSIVSQLQKQLASEKQISSTLQEETLQLRQHVSVLQFELEKEKNEKRKLIETSNRKNEEINRSPRAAPLSDQRHMPKLNGQTDSEDNLRMRITALSQSLLEKQSLINNLSADKQLLQIKVERLQDEMRQIGNEQSARSSGFSHTVVSNQPLYLSESPWDSGVSTSFKRAFSTVDSLCCQAGLALRRRPNLRLGFSVYIIVLHLWVFFILFHTFNHAPNPNSNNPLNNGPSPAP